MVEDVNWNHWSWWTLCNNPCNSGSRTRMRTCVPQTQAKYGGTNHCTDLAEEAQDCNGNVQAGKNTCFRVSYVYNKILPNFSYFDYHLTLIEAYY